MAAAPPEVSIAHAPLKSSALRFWHSFCSVDAKKISTSEPLSRCRDRKRSPCRSALEAMGSLDWFYWEGSWLWRGIELSLLVNCLCIYSTSGFTMGFMLLVRCATILRLGEEQFVNSNKATVKSFRNINVILFCSLHWWIHRKSTFCLKRYDARC